MRCGIGGIAEGAASPLGASPQGPSLPQGEGDARAGPGPTVPAARPRRRGILGDGVRVGYALFQVTEGARLPPIYRGLGPLDRLHFVQADIGRLPFPASLFTTICGSGAIRFTRIVTPAKR